LGGNQAKDASIGKILGPSFKQKDVPEVVDRILSTYVTLRQEDESFLDTYRRVGIHPFKERAYAQAD
jgi:sulfite reductase (NADPH) hemoprotein beta-component